MDDLRAWVLSAYGIDEADPDWVAYNAVLDPIEAEAKVHRAHFEALLAARIAAVEAEMSAALPDGFTVKFGD